MCALAHVCGRACVCVCVCVCVISLCLINKEIHVYGTHKVSKAASQYVFSNTLFMHASRDSFFLNVLVGFSSQRTLKSNIP